MRKVYLTSTEEEAVETLGRRVRAARLRRNLSQEDLAERAGVTRKTIAALEAGEAGVSVGVLAKALYILGYPDRLAGLLETDPIGEDLETGRKRAGRSEGVAPF
ncbi:hypothetical protein WV31_04770 [Magnetospirillum sp. ME-1]|uniref:helix-turn-helix transcriptional regulator n=1 Tax=Magnetospirillum sp. ME-1 TaxID=1639348 RepID=UPI000A17CA0E|nr:helix-turn-helix transcriptional regulator [Magnetospirillum sp. ME-1]ARJ65025.1 hypothetical protein WV31_04770 [Magnetospirillum sp. ME-1]